MRYALLIYGPETSDAVPEDVMANQTAAYNAFTQHIRDRGAYEGGEALHDTTSATTVRVVDGRTITTDGPFAETKEALGGLYVVSAADLDEAIAYAAMIPGASRGAVEVRPIWESASMDAVPAGAAGGSAG